MRPPGGKIRSYRQKELAAFTLGVATSLPRAIPPHLAASTRNKLVMLNKMNSLGDLVSCRGLHLEKLRGTLEDWWSIRINDQYRLTFRWIEGTVHDVEVSQHYRKL